eukprot:1025672_1
MALAYTTWIINWGIFSSHMVPIILILFIFFNSINVNPEFSCFKPNTPEDTIINAGKQPPQKTIKNTKRRVRELIYEIAILFSFGILCLIRMAKNKFTEYG